MNIGNLGSADAAKQALKQQGFPFETLESAAAASHWKQIPALRSGVILEVSTASSKISAAGVEMLERLGLVASGVSKGALCLATSWGCPH